ncbi:EAL domain-containing protein, partial [Kineococcus indalonis]|uniref:EAL domain-containing protein n=1 Tax=Kineococcus indalonis TaxID=2696566 RepID=UPI0014134D1E
SGEGLMRALDSWVLATACRELAAWPEPAPARVFVNTSPAQFARPGFAGEVAAVLASTGLPAERLTLEVLESGVLGAGAAAGFGALVDLGCTIALDDVGSGYSDLQRLLQVPAQVLKVDRAFTAHVPHPAGRAVLAALIAMSRDLQRTTVVEGVESPAALEVLRALGCTHAQGYLLGRPAPAPHR